MFESVYHGVSPAALAAGAKPDEERALAAAREPASCRMYSTDDEAPCTLGSMLTENNFDHEEEERLLALQVGESTEYGGGAWSRVVVRRVS